VSMLGARSSTAARGPGTEQKTQAGVQSVSMRSPARGGTAAGGTGRLLVVRCVGHHRSARATIALDEGWT
jgi:hypothetical protein